MTRYLPLLALCFFLMGQDDCEETSPQEPKAPYCDGATEPGALATAGSYVTGSYAAIVDGNVASDRKATVRININGSGWCSGTIIGPHTVLTAAHCEGDYYYIIIGYEDGPDSVGQDYSEYYFAPYDKKHERYIDWSQQDSRDHDMLLIYTDSTLPKPWATIYRPSMHSLCSAVAPMGWGKHEDLVSEGGDCAWHNNCSLRETRNWIAEEGETWISVRGMPGWICFGDSGGPSYCEVEGQPEPVVCAVTSSTSSSDCKLRSRLMKTEAFLDWILANPYESKPWEAQ